MNLEQWFTLALVIIGLSGGIWGIIKALLYRDRKGVEDQQEETRKWVEEIQKELSAAQIELAVLKERINGIPDRDFLQTKMDSMEEKLERKFDLLAARLQEVFEKGVMRLRCPHADGG